MSNTREPVYRTVSELSRGKTPEIIKSVEEDDKTVILTKLGKPTAVLISYERYTQLKYKEGNDI